MRYGRIFQVVAVMAACCVLAAIGGVAICPKCGYENAPDATSCTHCRAELTPVQAEPKKKPLEDGAEGVLPPGNVFLPSGKLQYLDSAVITNEVNLGMDYQKRGDLDLARLFLMNGAALQQLARPTADGGFMERILKLADQCRTLGRLVEKECPVCGGSGKWRMKVVSLKGKISYVDVVGKQCPRCSGGGKVTVPGSIQDWKTRMLEAGDRFALRQQGRKYMRVGDSWIPPEIDGKLSFRQISALKQAVAAACPECMGTGREDCPTCEGRGEIKCTNRACQQGLVSVEVDGKLTDSKLVRTEKCPVCQGRGVIKCPDCKGEGSQRCRKCGGTGKRAACSKCDGQGLTECRKCQGTGTYRDAPCPLCGGEKVTLCPSCQGDGKK